MESQERIDELEARMSSIESKLSWLIPIAYIALGMGIGGLLI